jgi:hypothetical protein
LAGSLQNKEMKKTFLISLMLCFMLSACNGQSNNPIAFQSRTPEPSSTAPAIPTAASTSIPTRIQSNELPSIPTFTPFPPYRNKGVVFNYYVVGNLADFIGFFDPPSGNIITRLVLYDDGQILIAVSGETYKQKVLSSEEIKSFLSRLETLGFYSLESTQEHDPTDKLYNFEGKYEEVGVIGGLRHCILVDADRSRNLCVHESYLQFLIPEMKRILQYLNEYKPAGMTPYQPDRLLLTIQADVDPSTNNPPVILWDERFPSLQKDSSRFTSGTSNQVIYIDGDMATEIYLFFEGTDTKVVSQNGKEYIVYLRVLLPHEKVKNPQP